MSKLEHALVSRQERLIDYMVVLGPKIEDGAFCRDSVRQRSDSQSIEPIYNLHTIIGKGEPDPTWTEITTVSDTCVNINAGLFKEHVRLFYTRVPDASTPVPITNIRVHSKEDPNPVQPCWRPVNERPFGRGDVTIYVERNPDYPPVLDVVILDPSKSESLPQSYTRCSPPLNSNVGGKKYQLCYRVQSQKSYSSNSFTCDVLFRFPTLSYQDNVLDVDGVKQLCFPNGISISTRSQLPTFLTFVSTKTDGTEIYGAALTSYEKLSGKCICNDVEYAEFCPMHSDNYHNKQVQQLKAGSSGGSSGSSSSSNGGGQIYLAYCICLLSRWPFLAPFKLLLEQLYRVSLNYSLEPYILRIILHTKTPSLGASNFSFPIGHAHVKFTFPPRMCIPSLAPTAGHSLVELFASLSPANIITVWRHLLTEGRVVLFSSSHTLLAPIAEAFRSLLYPFHWQCIFVPLLPLSMCFTLRAPFPFLVGVHRSFLDIIRVSSDILLVDLDNNRLKLPVQSNPHDASTHPQSNNLILSDPPVEIKVNAKLGVNNHLYLPPHHPNFPTLRYTPYCSRNLASFQSPALPAHIYDALEVRLHLMLPLYGRRQDVHATSHSYVPENDFNMFLDSEYHDDILPFIPTSLPANRTTSNNDIPLGITGNPLYRKSPFPQDVSYQYQAAMRQSNTSVNTTNTSSTTTSSSSSLRHRGSITNSNSGTSNNNSNIGRSSTPTTASEMYHYINESTGGIIAQNGTITIVPARNPIVHTPLLLKSRLLDGEDTVKYVLVSSNSSTSSTSTNANRYASPSSPSSPSASHYDMHNNSNSGSNGSNGADGSGGMTTGNCPTVEKDVYGDTVHHSFLCGLTSSQFREAGVRLAFLEVFCSLLAHNITRIHVQPQFNHVDWRVDAHINAKVNNPTQPSPYEVVARSKRTYDTKVQSFLHTPITERTLDTLTSSKVRSFNSNQDISTLLLPSPSTATLFEGSSTTTSHGYGYDKKPYGTPSNATSTGSSSQQQQQQRQNKKDIIFIEKLLEAVEATQFYNEWLTNMLYYSNETSLPLELPTIPVVQPVLTMLQSTQSMLLRKRASIGGADALRGLQDAISSPILTNASSKASVTPPSIGYIRSEMNQHLYSTRLVTPYNTHRKECLSLNPSTLTSHYYSTIFLRILYDLFSRKYLMHPSVALFDNGLTQIMMDITNRCNQTLWAPYNSITNTIYTPVPTPASTTSTSVSLRVGQWGLSLQSQSFFIKYAQLYRSNILKLVDTVDEKTRNTVQPKRPTQIMHTGTSTSAIAQVVPNHVSIYHESQNYHPLVTVDIKLCPWSIVRLLQWPCVVFGKDAPGDSVAKYVCIDTSSKTTHTPHTFHPNIQLLTSTTTSVFLTELLLAQIHALSSSSNPSSTLKTWTREAFDVLESDSIYTWLGLSGEKNTDTMMKSSDSQGTLSIDNNVIETIYKQSCQIPQTCVGWSHILPVTFDHNESTVIYPNIVPAEDTSMLIYSNITSTLLGGNNSTTSSTSNNSFLSKLNRAVYTTTEEDEKLSGITTDEDNDGCDSDDEDLGIPVRVNLDPSATSATNTNKTKSKSKSTTTTTSTATVEEDEYKHHSHTSATHTDDDDDTDISVPDLYTPWNLCADVVALRSQTDSTDVLLDAITAPLNILTEQLVVPALSQLQEAQTHTHNAITREFSSTTGSSASPTGTSGSGTTSSGSTSSHTSHTRLDSSSNVHLNTGWGLTSERSFMSLYTTSSSSSLSNDPYNLASPESLSIGNTEVPCILDQIAKSPLPLHNAYVNSCSPCPRDTHAKPLHLAPSLCTNAPLDVQEVSPPQTAPLSLICTSPLSWLATNMVTSSIHDLWMYLYISRPQGPLHTILQALAYTNGPCTAACVSMNASSTSTNNNNTNTNTCTHAHARAQDTPQSTKKQSSSKSSSSSSTASSNLPSSVSKRPSLYQVQASMVPSTPSVTQFRHLKHVLSSLVHLSVAELRLSETQRLAKIEKHLNNVANTRALANTLESVIDKYLRKQSNGVIRSFSDLSAILPSITSLDTASGDAYTPYPTVGGVSAWLRYSLQQDYIAVLLHLTQQITRRSIPLASTIIMILQFLQIAGMEQAAHAMYTTFSNHVLDYAWDTHQVTTVASSMNSQLHGSSSGSLHTPHTLHRTHTINTSEPSVSTKLSRTKNDVLGKSRGGGSNSPFIGGVSGNSGGGSGSGSSGASSGSSASIWTGLTVRKGITLPGLVSLASASYSFANVHPNSTDAAVCTIANHLAGTSTNSTNSSSSSSSSCSSTNSNTNSSATRTPASPFNLDAIDTTMFSSSSSTTTTSSTTDPTSTDPTTPPSPSGVSLDALPKPCLPWPVQVFATASCAQCKLNLSTSEILASYTQKLLQKLTIQASKSVNSPFADDTVECWRCSASILPKITVVFDGSPCSRVYCDSYYSNAPYIDSDDDDDDDDDDDEEETYTSIGSSRPSTSTPRFSSFSGFQNSKSKGGTSSITNSGRSNPLYITLPLVSPTRIRNELEQLIQHHTYSPDAFVYDAAGVGMPAPWSGLNPSSDLASVLRYNLHEIFSEPPQTTASTTGTGTGTAGTYYNFQQPVTAAHSPSPLSVLRAHPTLLWSTFYFFAVRDAHPCPHSSNFETSSVTSFLPGTNTPGTLPSSLLGTNTSTANTNTNTNTSTNTSSTSTYMKTKLLSGMQSLLPSNTLGAMQLLLTDEPLAFTTPEDVANVYSSTNPTSQDPILRSNVPVYVITQQAGADWVVYRDGHRECPCHTHDATMDSDDEDGDEDDIGTTNTRMTAPPPEHDEVDDDLVLGDTMLDPLQYIKQTSHSHHLKAAQELWKCANPELCTSINHVFPVSIDHTRHSSITSTDASSPSATSSPTSTPSSRSQGGRHRGTISMSLLPYLKNFTNPAGLIKTQGMSSTYTIAEYLRTSSGDLNINNALQLALIARIAKTNISMITSSSKYRSLTKRQQEQLKQQVKEHMMQNSTTGSSSGKLHGISSSSSSSGRRLSKSGKLDTSSSSASSSSSCTCTSQLYLTFPTSHDYYSSTELQCLQAYHIYFHPILHAKFTATRKNPYYGCPRPSSPHTDDTHFSPNTSMLNILRKLDANTALTPSYPGQCTSENTVSIPLILRAPHPPKCVVSVQDAHNSTSTNTNTSTTAPSSVPLCYNDMVNAPRPRPLYRFLRAYARALLHLRIQSHAAQNNKMLGQASLSHEFTSDPSVVVSPAMRSSRSTTSSSNSSTTITTSTSSSNTNNTTGKSSDVSITDSPEQQLQLAYTQATRSPPHRLARELHGYDYMFSSVFLSLVSSVESLWTVADLQSGCNNGVNVITLAKPYDVKSAPGRYAFWSCVPMLEEMDTVVQLPSSQYADDTHDVQFLKNTLLENMSFLSSSSSETTPNPYAYISANTRIYLIYASMMHLYNENRKHVLQGIRIPFVSHANYHPASTLDVPLGVFDTCAYILTHMNSSTNTSTNTNTNTGTNTTDTSTSINTTTGTRKDLVFFLKTLQCYFSQTKSAPCATLPIYPILNTNPQLGSGTNTVNMLNDIRVDILKRQRQLAALVNANNTAAVNANANAAKSSNIHVDTGAVGTSITTTTTTTSPTSTSGGIKDAYIPPSATPMDSRGGGSGTATDLSHIEVELSNLALPTDASSSDVHAHVHVDGGSTSSVDTVGGGVPSTTTTTHTNKTTRSMAGHEYRLSVSMDSDMFDEDTTHTNTNTITSNTMNDMRQRLPSIYTGYDDEEEECELEDIDVVNIEASMQQPDEISEPLSDATANAVNTNTTTNPAETSYDDSTNTNTTSTTTKTQTKRYFNTRHSLPSQVIPIRINNTLTSGSTLLNTADTDYTVYKSVCFKLSIVPPLSDLLNGFMIAQKDIPTLKLLRRFACFACYRAGISGYDMSIQPYTDIHVSSFSPSTTMPSLSPLSLLIYFRVFVKALRDIFRSKVTVKVCAWEYTHPIDLQLVHPLTALLGLQTSFPCAVYNTNFTYTSESANAIVQVLCETAVEIVSRYFMQPTKDTLNRHIPVHPFTKLPHIDQYLNDILLFPSIFRENSQDKSTCNDVLSTAVLLGELCYQWVIPTHATWLELCHIPKTGSTGTTPGLKKPVPSTTRHEHLASRAPPPIPPRRRGTMSMGSSEVFQLTSSASSASSTSALSPIPSSSYSSTSSSTNNTGKSQIQLTPIGDKSGYYTHAELLAMKEDVEQRMSHVDAQLRKTGWEPNSFTDAYTTSTSTTGNGITHNTEVATTPTLSLTSTSRTSMSRAGIYADQHQTQQHRKSPIPQRGRGMTIENFLLDSNEDDPEL